MLNRQGLDVLVHPLTDNSYDDHSRYAVWLGAPVPLRLNPMSRTYRAEQYPTPHCAGQPLFQPSSRTSVRRPVTAAAAAIAGPIRWVLAFLPWRPSKLRFEVEAMRSPFTARSLFIEMQFG